MMSEQVIRVAINGYGRIGRCVLRALYECGFRQRIRIVAINEPADIGSLVHLTKFDSTHGTFAGEVEQEGDCMRVNGDRIMVFNECEVEALDWGALDVDVVYECSGRCHTRQQAQRHLERGAGKVMLSCPAPLGEVDATIVYGFNEQSLDREHRIISNASCTTNCTAHIIDTVDRMLGIEQGVVTIVHSSMNDQPVIDAYHNPDLRKSRSSGMSIIPVSTGLARGIERLFPHLAGRFEAIQLRVPTMNVSLMELTVSVKRNTDVGAVNAILRERAENGLGGVLGYSELPLVSCDFNHNASSAVVDGSQTLVSGGSLVTIVAWFDNEWGFANRMLDVTLACGKKRGRE